MSEFEFITDYVPIRPGRVVRTGKEFPVIDARNGKIQVESGGNSGRQVIPIGWKQEKFFWILKIGKVFM